MNKQLVSRIMTFSIVAYDPKSGDFGVAVQSKFPCVGQIVPWAKSNVGAIATQADVNTSFGPRGLELLNKGMTPDEVIGDLLKDDEKRDQRQPTTSTANKGEKWSPSLPKREPEELAQIFRSKDSKFKQYLFWYDLKVEGGIPFRLIADIKTGRDSKEQEVVFKRVIEKKNKRKIGKPIKGESAVRRGFNYIYRAIYRTRAPLTERGIEINSRLPIGRYDCPQHGNECPMNCSYLKKWMSKFDNLQKDVPLIGIHAGLHPNKFHTQRKK